MVVLLVGLVLALLFVGTSNADTYGSRLEEYISNKNPTNTYDVERYAREFEEQNSRSIL